MAKETTIRYGLRVSEGFQIDTTVVTLIAIKRGEVFMEVKPSPPEVKKRAKRKRR